MGLVDGGDGGDGCWRSMSYDGSGNGGCGKSSVSMSKNERVESVVRIYV